MSTTPDPKQIATLTSATYDRIGVHLNTTRLLHDTNLDLWFKCEHEQKTGSFKWRGALSKLSLYTPGQAIVTASTGNHGLGVAYASSLFDLKATIFIPSTASPEKRDKLIALGVHLIQVEGDSLDAETKGKQYAMENNLPWVSPYNDVDVIAGQGTIGLEVNKELDVLDKIYITVGGGGLMSGIASWYHEHSPSTEIIGCQPLNSPEMHLSVLAGHVVTAPESLPTLSDGSAGPLEEDSITFDLCNELIDRFMLITEAEIEEAIKYLYDTHQLVVEGAAGVAMAAAMKDKQRHADDQSVVILCGGNIAPAVHQRICGY